MVRAADSDNFLIQHTDFSLREQVNYPNGGISKFYDKNGNLEHEQNYKEYVLHGTERIYEDGKVVLEREYKDGEIVSSKNLKK